MPGGKVTGPAAGPYKIFRGLGLLS